MSTPTTTVQAAQKAVDIALANYNAAIKEFQTEGNVWNRASLEKAVSMAKSALDEAQENLMQVSVGSASTSKTPTDQKTNYLPLIIAGVVVVAVVVFIIIKRRKK